MTVGALVSVLILLVVLVLICIVVKWFVDYMRVPHPINVVVLALVGLLCLLVLLQASGLLGGAPLDLRR